MDPYKYSVDPKEGRGKGKRWDKWKNVARREM